LWIADCNVSPPAGEPTLVVKDKVIETESQAVLNTVTEHDFKMHIKWKER
jgi:hypothetical protein